MLLRGATEAEVARAIQTGAWQPARRDKFQARQTFVFGRPSPVNRQISAYKTVHAIFADESAEIVVVTVLVYYGDQGAI